MRSPFIGAIFASALLLVACDSKKPAFEKPPTTETPATKTSTLLAPLVDLTASSSLAPVRTAFNAHKGEARFLTLLSPT